MRHRALHIGLSVFAALLIGCNKSDFPTAPSPVADTPLTTLSGLKVDGSASLPGGGQTPFNMTLIARSLDLTAPGALAQTPGSTEVYGNFALGTGVTGTLVGSLEGSLENGRLHGTLASSANGCSRQYDGMVSTAGLAWLTSDSTGGCPLPISVQASRADAPSECGYSISSLGSVPGGGGTTVVEITTGPRCTWVVEAQAPWVHVSGPSIGMGPGTVTLVVDPSEVPRQGRLFVAGQSLSIEQTPACTVAVAPQSVSFSEAGGSRTLTITTPAGCEWRAESVPAWLAVSPGSGRGTTTVTLVAEPNSGAQREASLRVAGQTVTITQAGRSGGPAPCIEGVTLSATRFPAVGGTGSIDVAASAACAWSAQSDVPWIVLSGGSGTGAGRSSFTIQVNSGPERTGTVRVAGRVLTITQEGVQPCSYRVSLSQTAFPASGGTGTVTVTVESGCEWVVESTVDWIRVQTGAARGSGSAQFAVVNNPTGSPRQGELRIAGQSFIVTQEAPPCTYRVLVSPTAFPASGGTGTVAVTAESACEWVVESTVDWIRVQAGAGRGSGSPQFIVAANPTADPAGTPRQGELRIAGQSFIVTQGAPPPCTYRVSVSPNTFPSSGGTGTVVVTVDDSCDWVVESMVDWITVQTRAGRGSGSAQFTVLANPTGSPRQGELRIAGQSHIVRQEPLLAPVTVTLSSPGVLDSCGDDVTCRTIYGGGSVVANGFACSIAEAVVSGRQGTRTQICIGSFPVGFSVTFTAQPGENSDFAGWGQSCGTGPTCIITVAAAGHSLTATFILEPLDLNTVSPESLHRKRRK